MWYGNMEYPAMQNKIKENYMLIDKNYMQPQFRNLNRLLMPFLGVARWQDACWRSMKGNIPIEVVEQKVNRRIEP
jgi:hypothetical protein